MDKISPFGRNDKVWFEMTSRAAFLRNDIVGGAPSKEQDVGQNAILGN